MVIFLYVYQRVTFREKMEHDSWIQVLQAWSLEYLHSYQSVLAWVCDNHAASSLSLDIPSAVWLTSHLPIMYGRDDDTCADINLSNGLTPHIFSEISILVDVMLHGDHPQTWLQYTPIFFKISPAGCVPPNIYRARPKVVTSGNQVSVTRQQLHLFSSYCSKPPLPSEIRRDLLNAHQMRAPHLAEEAMWDHIDINVSSWFVCAPPKQ